MADIMKSLLVGFLLCGVAMAQEKPRVYLQTVEPSTIAVNAYAAPSHNEQIRVLSQACPSLVITDTETDASLTLRWESKTWQQTSWHGFQQEYSLLRGTDVIGSGASHHIKNAAKDICKLIEAKQNAVQTSQAAISH